MEVWIFFGQEPTNTNIPPASFTFRDVLSTSADGDKN